MRIRTFVVSAFLTVLAIPASASAQEWSEVQINVLASSGDVLSINRISCPTAGGGTEVVTGANLQETLLASELKDLRERITEWARTAEVRGSGGAALGTGEYTINGVGSDFKLAESICRDAGATGS